MNARADINALSLPVRLTSPYEKTIEVEVYGVPMTVTYEYDEGERAQLSGGPESWHPGTPPNASLLSCTVGGVDITEMLSPSQTETIEEAILDRVERF